MFHLKSCITEVADVLVSYNPKELQIFYSNSTPCSKQGQLEQVAQDVVQMGFGYLQQWRYA